jgi:hypothetical protein
MILDQGERRYLCEREEGIYAWYGEALDETTVIALIHNITTGAKVAPNREKGPYDGDD